MPYSIFLPLPFQLSAISFPLHNLQIESSPIRLNHEYYSDLFLNDFLLIIPECFGILSVFIVLLYGVFFSDRKGEKRFDVAVHDLNKQDLGGILGVNSSWIAILSIAFTILLFLNNPISNASVLYSCFLLDDFGLFLKILVLVATLFSIVISLQYLEREKLNNFELQTIILISSIMMLFLISSVDFISIYLAIECQSLCFYVMAGMKRESEFSTEAGLKYFLLGAFSSGILLFGFALQYGFTGTTNFSELSKIFLSIHDAWGDSSVALVEQASQDTASVLPGISSFFSTPSLSASTNDFQQITELTPLATKRGCELGMIFILVGFLFKVSAVPFHMWAPDVYEGAPTSVTAFFAIVPKISIFAICLRLCYGASYGFILSWQKILILSSILSMVVGSFAALAQNKVKRLLAWSAIGHVGFILTALGCGTIEGSQAVVFYLVIYVIMTIALFQIILLPLRREKINSFLFSRKISDKKDSSYIAKGVPQEVLRSKPKSGGQIATFDDLDESDNRAIKYTTDLAFLSQTYPVIAMTIMVTMFSIAGIPPLAGFWSKAFLLFAAMSAKQFVLAIIVILTSVISCFYYIRIVKIMYFEAQLPKWRTASKEKSQTSVLTFMPISKESCLVWGIMVALLIFFCFNATALFKATHFISLSLA